MKKIIAFDISHNEEERLKNILKEIKLLLEKNYISVKKHENYPITIDNLKNFDVFIIIQTDHSHFDSNELKHIDNYVNSGGSLLLLGNAGGDRAHLTNFSEVIVSNFGISFNEDRIIDQNKSLEENSAFFSINETIKHVIFTNVSPSYLNGCSLNVKHTSARILAKMDENSLIAEVKHGLGKVIIIGSYLMFQNSENTMFFMNIVRYLTGDLKPEKIQAPKFQIKMPEKLTKGYALKSKEREIDSTSEITADPADFLRLIEKINSEIKKFSFHKDLTRIKLIKNSFSLLEDGLKNALEIHIDDSKSNPIPPQIEFVQAQFITLYDNFLEMDVGIEDRGHVINFQELFNELRLKIEKRFHINLLSEINSENKIDLEIEKLRNRINNLKYQNEELEPNRKYLTDQFNSSIISKVEYELGLRNLEDTKKANEERISYLEGRIKLLSSI